MADTPRPLLRPDCEEKEETQMEAFQMVRGPVAFDHTGGARRRVGPGLRRGYIGASGDRGKEAGELRPRRPGSGPCEREAAPGGQTFC